MDLDRDVGLPDQKVTLCLIFGGTAMLSATAAAPVSSPSGARGLPFLHVLAHTRYSLSFGSQAL